MPKIWFLGLETYFYDISNVHCCDINTGEEEHQYSMQEIIVDIIDDYSNRKVLIVNIFNLEHSDLAEKVIIRGDTLFELSKIIGTIKIGNFKWCGHICS